GLVSACTPHSYLPFLRTDSPRPLHSFPTRRSSDLAPRRTAEPAPRPSAPARPPPTRASSTARLRPAEHGTARRRPARRPATPPWPAWPAATALDPTSLPWLKHAWRHRPSAHQVTTRVAEIDHPGHREKCSPPIATTREGPCCFPSDVRLRRRRAPRWPPPCSPRSPTHRSEEHTSELQSRENLVCRLLL